MSLPNAYSLKTSSIPIYFEEILRTEIPNKFDAGFMSSIGFRYAIDRSFIDILKELHFLSDSGMPTKRYMDFHSLDDARDALLDGIHEAYSKLYRLHSDAADLSEPQVVDALKQLYEGKKTDMMINGIASTFLALCRFADNLDAVTAAVQQSRDAAENASQQNASPPAPPSPHAAAATAQEAAAPQQPETTTASETVPLHLVLESKRDDAGAEGAPAAAPEPMLPVLEKEADDGTADAAPAMHESVAAQAAPEPELPVLELETPLATAAPEAPVPDAPAPADLLAEPAAAAEPAAPQTPPPAPVPGRETPLIAHVVQSPPPPPETPEQLVLELESEAGDAAPSPAASAASHDGDGTAHAAHASFDAAAPFHLVLESEMDDAGAEDTPAAAPESMPRVLEEEPAADTADAAPAMPESVTAQAAPEPELPVLEPETPLATAAPEAPVPDAAVGEPLPPVFDAPAPASPFLEAPSPLGNADDTFAMAQDSMQDAAPPSPPDPLQAAATPPDASPGVGPAAVRAAPLEDAATAAPQQERTVIPASLVFDLDAPPLKETPPENAAAPSPDAASAAAQATACDTNKGATKTMRYPIQIVLPESTDVAVYDAIFTSLKRHLFTPGE
ncbi:DUF5343 domain-containing protein [Solidesulfovibrio sp.]|uniref:DUF5343 domain-containing protein n=1 Tax=Solidesulfovibrio sp. TaxID=2910990 RepID=UPI002B1F6B33|nr:DUF5343 domain-containing protein [Solidesulfovibrio sp.]